MEFPWQRDGSSAQSNQQQAQATQQNLAAQQLTRGPQVERAQRILVELGYSVGQADGIVGPRTRKAVSAYQRDRGLPRDGKVTAGLIQSLETTLRNKKAQASAESRPSPKASPKPASKVSKLRLGKLPVYERGSTFVYSDGNVERVVAIKGSTVRWAGHDGTHFTAYRNFLLPWAYWQTTAERGTSTLDGDPDSFWPIKGDQEISFSAQVAIQNRLDTKSIEQTVETWRCRLIGSENVQVMAGTFDTVKIGCEREGSSAKQATRRLWYYAANLGHYVRLDEEFENPLLNRTSELVAIQPAALGWPPIARAALDRAVLQVLETKPDGAREEWSSSGVETKVTIEPAARFQRADGTFCRSYIQSWSGPDGERRYPGAACLDDKGRWRIPGLDADPRSSVAISGTHS